MAEPHDFGYGLRAEFGIRESPPSRKVRHAQVKRDGLPISRTHDVNIPKRRRDAAIG
jgi:hypothetical protein